MSGLIPTPVKHRFPTWGQNRSLNEVDREKSKQYPLQREDPWHLDQQGVSETILKMSPESGGKQIFYKITKLF